MNKNIKYTLAAMVFACWGNAMAQNPYGAYFMDGYAFGHQMNPAKEYDRSGYFSTPLSGNTNIALRGNLNLKDVLYTNPNGKGLVTYLHPSISVDEAMSHFSSDNKLISDFRYDLFSVGFHALKGYNTIGLGLRINGGVNIPYGLLDLTKNLQNKDYSISDLGVSAQSYAELSYGYSTNVTPYLRIGGKAKVLFGLAYTKAKMDDLTLNLKDENQWTATAHVRAEVGIKGFTWGEPKVKEYSDAYKENNPGADTYESVDFDNADVDGFGLGGFGLGFDLGAELDLGKLGLVDGLKASAAILDVGFIKWKDVAVAQNKGAEFKFDGFQDVKVDDGNGTKLDDQTDDIGDRLSDLFAIEEKGTESTTTTLGATLNVGVEYTLPTYNKLSFGLLSTTRIQGEYSWNEERLSVNYHPAKWFEVGVSGGVGTLGTSVGWVFNCHPAGINLFLAGDHIIGKLSKQGIPLNSNADISLGITVPFGKAKSRD